MTGLQRALWTRQARRFGLGRLVEVVDDSGKTRSTRRRLGRLGDVVERQCAGGWDCREYRGHYTIARASESARDAEFPGRPLQACRAAGSGETRNPGRGFTFRRLGAWTGPGRATLGPEGRFGPEARRGQRRLGEGRWQRRGAMADGGYPRPSPTRSPTWTRTSLRALGQARARG